jgi:G2/mitotic-specific cyclin 2
MGCACIMADHVITQVSILVREWALERWEEGEQVSLATELPAIHSKNRAESERQAAAGGEEVKDENS